MNLDFDPHALDRMRRRQIPRIAVYHLVAEYDRRVDRDDARTDYFGMWEGREILVVLEWEDEEEMSGYVITVIDRDVRRRGRR